MSITDKTKEVPVVKLLLNILKIADEPAYTHSIEVAYITEELLSRIDNEWSETEREAIIIGALIHDIGKAFLPFNIQSSSMALDFNRKVIMQSHCNLGYEIVRNCGFDEISEEIVLLHHERSDGSGYPLLDQENFPVFSEENIPDYVSLVSYADVLSALITDKPYREGLTMEEAIEEVCKEIDKGKLSYKFKKALLAYGEENKQ